MTLKVIKLNHGDRVRLTSKPDGYESGQYKIHIGDEFLVEYVDGCCLCVEKDEEFYTINSERFEKIN